MSWEEFWHKDKRLFEVYRKSYYRNLHETAWLNGLYYNISLQNTVANVLAKKGEKPKEYPNEPFDPFEEKTVITNDNLEEGYRDLQQKQNNFIRMLLNNKK